MEANASFLSNAQYPIQNDILGGYVGRVLDSLNGWTVALTIFLGLVLYDQCQLLSQNLFALLTNCTDWYIVKKGSIPGTLVKLPFVGAFVQSIHPKFENYYKQWQIGPLSCVSVFHK
jgi:sterol 22-desaturase